MKSSICGILLLVFLGVATLPSASTAEAMFGWKGSTYIKDEEKGYSIKFGGRIMSDWVINSPDDDFDAAFSTHEDGTRFRRVRFYSSGTMYHVSEYKLQLDFAKGEIAFKDVFVGLKKVPVVGSIRVGHQYEPIGLETVTSSKVITFIERASVTTLFPERKTGALITRKFKSNDVVLRAGVFTNSSSSGDVNDPTASITGRLTARPYVSDEGDEYVHVGVAASRKNAPEDMVFRIKAKTENPIGPTVADTDTILADNVTLFGGEAVAVFGPVSLQGEVAMASFTSASGDSTGDPGFMSYYVQGTWTLTGEHREYKDGVMEGITPAKNYDGKGGSGAVELAARISMMDLTDGNVMGGEFLTFTGGVNWYLNPYTRVMVNYSYTDVDGVGTMNSFMTRFQISF